ncbi:hypothetical protein AB0F65_17630 [Nocardia rhamnosiphila]|uniref:hypothetical protein n=1 Tax=Nocardia rhamnosiphila TaxID=426716 RepID=UPI0033D6BA79
MTLREDELKACRYAVSEMLRARRRVGAPVPEWLRRIDTRLDAELVECASRTGHDTDTTDRNSEVIGVTEAARLLGCTARHVRRLAADLDGQRAGRAWVFDRRTVAEYANARTE